MLRDATATSSVRAELAGKHVFLTGVTGFLGKVWLAHTLAHLPEIGRVTLLARPSKGVGARERVERILATSPAFRHLRERHGEGFSDFAADRLAVVEGDVTRPGLGLKEPPQGVDVTLHCAGLTDFQPEPARAIAINVHGARNVADLVATFEHPRLLHVSTCYVAGVRQGRIEEDLPAVSPRGEAFDPEEEVARLDGLDRDGVLRRATELGWPNVYTLTKGLGEHLLARRTDLSLATVRPSIVECALDDPFRGWNEGLNTAGPLSWLLSTPFRAFPAREEIALDVVPVDRVARSLTLVLAALCRGETGVYQVATSERNPLTMGRAIELNGLATRKHERDAAFRRFLDPVPTPADSARGRGIGAIARAVGQVKEVVRELSVPKAMKPIRKLANERLRETHRTLRRIETMLELYRPFIHDHDWVFVADRLKALSEAEDEAAFRVDLEAIDWRAYWIDVEVPGLQRWSFPLLRGERVPDDPPTVPVSLLQGADAARRTA